MTGLAVLTVLAVPESTLPSFKFSYKIHYQETTVTVLAVSVVAPVCRDGYPPYTQLGISQKGSPEQCFFSPFPVFFPFSSVFSLFSFRFIFRRKQRNGETPFAATPFAKP